MKVPEEIAEALTKRGIKGITGQYVSTILSKERSNSKPKKRKSAKKKQVWRRAAATRSVELESVEAAADFISMVGGLGEAKQALSSLRRSCGSA